MYTNVDGPRPKTAIIGTGIAGMSASWLLAQRHDISVYEKDDRIGGHTNTVVVPDTDIGVDTGFIVYNERNYPNLIALLDHFKVETSATDMSFGVSIDQGDFEYSGSDIGGLFAQKRNLLRGRFWTMLQDILRFYRQTNTLLATGNIPNVTLGAFLSQNEYSSSFCHDHILPMGAAIWSTPVDVMMEYPLEAFIRFCDNHGLLQINNRPKWHTIQGGSRNYVEKLTASYRDTIRTNSAAAGVWQQDQKVIVEDRAGRQQVYDNVVFACHANEALALIKDAESAEQKLLSAFSYQPNVAVLHTDTDLMPRTRRAWSSWNYICDQEGTEPEVCVTYWMNRLQHIEAKTNYFVTLNPNRLPNAEKVIRSFLYQHPLFDRNAVAAQRLLWNIQGKRGLWFCGSYFGHGFHEDALQSGLAVGETLGGVRRPWKVANESGRIHLPESWRNWHRQEAA